MDGVADEIVTRELDSSAGITSFTLHVPGPEPGIPRSAIFELLDAQLQRASKRVQSRRASVRRLPVPGGMGEQTPPRCPRGLAVAVHLRDVFLRGNLGD